MSGVMLPEVPQGASVEEAGHFRERVLIQANENLAWSFLICGKMLHEIVASGWLNKLGETMETFLASRSLSISPPMASKLIRIYRVLVVEKGLKPEDVAEIGDYEKAYIMSQIVENGVMPVQEALAHAKTNSRSDLQAIKTGGDPKKPDIEAIVTRIRARLNPTFRGFLKGLLKFHMHDKDATHDALLEYERLKKYSPHRLKEIIKAIDKLDEPKLPPGKIVIIDDPKPQDPAHAWKELKASIK